MGIVQFPGNYIPDSLKGIIQFPGSPGIGSSRKLSLIPLETGFRQNCAQGY